MNHLLGSNSSCREKIHRGSTPTLLPQAQGELQGLWLQQKRLSVDVLRNKSPDLWHTKSASLLAICKWKQTLTEKLLKRHHGSCTQVRMSLLEENLINTYLKLYRGFMNEILDMLHGVWNFTFLVFWKFKSFKPMCFAISQFAKN